MNVRTDRIEWIDQGVFGDAGQTSGHTVHPKGRRPVPFFPIFNIDYTVMLFRWILRGCHCSVRVCGPCCSSDKVRKLRLASYMRMWLAKLKFGERFRVGFSPCGFVVWREKILWREKIRTTARLYSTRSTATSAKRTNLVLLE